MRSLGSEYKLWLFDETAPKGSETLDAAKYWYAPSLLGTWLVHNSLGLLLSVTNAPD
jgi:hypothetical protein